MLTVTKKNPEAVQLPGFYRLLPQLVGSFDPGGVVASGMGDAARMGLFNLRRPASQDTASGYAADRAASRTSRSFSAINIGGGPRMWTRRYDLVL